MTVVLHQSPGKFFLLLTILDRFIVIGFLALLLRQ